jgi:hypothetical protein
VLEIYGGDGWTLNDAIFTGALSVVGKIKGGIYAEQGDSLEALNDTIVQRLRSRRRKIFSGIYVERNTVSRG